MIDHYTSRTDVELLKEPQTFPPFPSETSTFWFQIHCSALAGPLRMAIFSVLALLAPCPSFCNKVMPKKKKIYIYAQNETKDILLFYYISNTVPVVPHKAVTEVSKKGNL